MWTRCPIDLEENGWLAMVGDENEDGNDDKIGLMVEGRILTHDDSVAKQDDNVQDLMHICVT